MFSSSKTSKGLNFQCIRNHCKPTRRKQSDRKTGEKHKQIANSSGVQSTHRYMEMCEITGNHEIVPYSDLTERN
jgi:hypothetical protein